MALKNVVTPLGVAVFPNLNQPNTRFDPDGMFECKLRIIGEDAEKFEESLKEYYEEQVDKLKEDNKKSKTYKMADLPIEEETDEEGDPTGYYIVKMRTKAVREDPKTGEKKSKKITFKDAKGRECPGVEVGGGSVMRVACVPTVSAVAAQKSFFLTLRPFAVQIKELVELGSGSYDFDELEGGFEADEDAMTEKEVEPNKEEEGDVSDLY
jgi:hypothetical protein